MLLVLWACAELPQDPEDPEEPEGLTELMLPFQNWAIDVLAFDEAYNEPSAKGDLVTGGVEDGYALGFTFTPPIPDEDGVAVAEIFATESGITYWVSAQAPTGAISGESLVGAVVDLAQYFSFRKDSEGASLRFTITGAYMEILDHNLAFPLSVCSWQTDPPVSERGDVCRDVITAQIEAAFTAYTADPAYADVFPVGVFFAKSGKAGIRGFDDDINPVFFAGVGYKSSRDLFELSDFSLDVPGNDIRHLQLRLKSPITVEVPLDEIAVGTEFDVVATAKAKAWSRRLNESYAAAYFRDPASTGAAPSIEYAGLTPLEASAEIPEDLPVAGQAPACEAEGSSTIQFEAASYFEPEWPGDEAEITVTRTGEGGEASALFTTGGGTATPGSRDTPGSDYEPVTTHVWFAAGETGTRTVYVPIIADLDAEPAETVLLTLSDPSGCAGLGDKTNATLTIRDDDGEGIEESFTIGGTVTGLEGSGLVLTNNSTDDLDIDEDGEFVFGRRYATGVIYNVRVDTQPSEPLQSCTLTNGSGTVAGQNVTDIAVDCETLPPPSDNLDPSFGAGGMVTLDVNYTGTQGNAPDVALQDDGKVVVVSGNTLARYNADGSLDGGFGAGGVVTVEFYGASYDRLNAVGVQPDGRIVVAGYSKDGVNSPTQDDIVVARYNADGTLDASFGTGGQVVTDFEEHQDIAYDLVIQPDGKIVVTGLAATIDEGNFGVYYPDFAAVRYTSDGQLDGGFGDGGKASTSLDTETDYSYGAALQPDGKIVLVGRVGVAGTDIGVVRYNADGSLDSGFGNGGILLNVTALWDEAADVVVQPDGKIVVVGFTLHEGGIGNPAPDTLTIERYNADGSYDATFGTGGRVQTPLMAPGRAVALQPDGGIVIAGVEQNGASADYAVARFTPTGELDTSFGTDGLIQVDFFADLDIANAVVLQPDGRVIVAGSVRNGANTLLGLIRVLP